MSIQSTKIIDNTVGVSDKPVDKSQQVIKKMRPLTRKQAAFVRHMVENPKDSATTAAFNTYDVKTRRTAEVIASENLMKPEIRLELAKYSNDAEMTVLEVMETSRNKMHSDERRGVDWGTLAQRTAESLLDRVHGKAKQSIDITSKSVNININLDN